MKKRNLMNWLGLLGIASFVSYVAAMIFAPMAYPGYDWMSQAVSDLSAVTAPSKMLWAQISTLYDVGGIVTVTLVCIYVQGKLTKSLRVGIDLFTIMSWISSVGFHMFPLANPNKLGGFQDVMHLVVTAFVVLLSIISLIIIIVAGFRSKEYRSIAIWATITFCIMLVGAIGTNIVPKMYFGIVERFSTTAVTGFTAVLGTYLFMDFWNKEFRKK